MKSRLIYYMFLLILVCPGKAQTWMPLGSGISGTDINTTWALCAYDSVMFAGGWFNNAGGTAVNNIAQWSDTKWSSTGSGTNGFISAMAVYHGRLYAGGQFDSIGGVAASDIAMWNGFNWMPVGLGIKGGDYGVYSLAVYNGRLYAGGSFDTAGGKAIFGIAQWNDTNWSAVGTGVSTIDEDDGVFALAVYQGNLYLAGDFVVAGSTNIAQWNGTSMSGVGGGTVGAIYALATYNNNLYIGGMISLAGAIEANCIAVWNNTTWSTIDSGITGENGWASVNGLTVYNNELYIGGFFDTVNGAPMNCITKWDGTKFSPVGSGINVGGAIDAITIYNNSLYIGGGFDSAGGVYAKNIAMLTSPTSINEISTINKLTVYPNPANTVLSIEMEQSDANMSYTIYNILGQEVETEKLSPSEITNINISTYISGIYLLVASDGSKQYNTKFIKN